MASCGAGSSCSTATAKGTCRKLDGQACGAAAECGSGFCAGGSCCKTACSTTTHTCSAAGKAGTCLKLLGQAASSGAECASGFVADGVCCDTACTGKCTSCKAVDTGGADGTCAAIPEGKDPASECPDPADVNSCGPDGLCDGKGACRTFAPEGKTCGSATCASGEIAGNICNGSGACVVSKKDCAPYVCAADAKSCLGACTSDADCKDKSMRCNVAGVCVARAKNGDACAAASECESKHCVDGVCCNNACDGQCQACNLAGSAGTCSAVKGEPVGGRAACSGAGTPCAGACDGVAATCSYPSIGTDCGSTCTAGTYVEKKCDNKGSCAEKTPVSCNLYACSATGCKDRCDTAADCASSEVDCKDGRCVPRASASCADDGVTLIESDGTQKDCTPRRCAGGTCIETCVRSDTDCASGYLCSEGTCVPRPAEAIDSGCGCAVPGRTSRASEAVAIALALLALRRRSSRPRRGGPHVERTLRRRSR